MTARPLRRLATVLVLGMIGLGLSGCSGNGTSDAAHVTYHDSTGDHTLHISRSEFTDELEALTTNKEFVAALEKNGFTGLGTDVSTDQRLASIWLTQMIRQSAAQAEFTSAKLQLTADDTNSAGQLEQNDFGQALVKTLPAGFLSAVRPRYEQMAAVYRYYATCPSGKFVSHILVRTQKQAAATRKAIVSGRGSFADLAKAQSIDTQSGQNGGALGCLSPSEFVTPFQTAAEAAPVGVVTEPVKTQFGYHLILVRPWNPETDQAASASTLAQAGSAVLIARLNDLKVWVNPLYGTWGSTTDSSGNKALAVIPPTVPNPRTCRETTPQCTPGSTTSTTVPAGG